ncbi:MAG: dihydrodipicolinate synthase family protein [Chloroflexi bacterium]|nr:dihydrodipicolinate synthase family protein [Chloroflexota bacterium]|tara:strand:+ start:4156 stop:5058 length:903 start_codon:yes stop_codon:yes gene_type:complete
MINEPERPILVAPMPTPFSLKDEVNLEAVENNSIKWINSELSGFVLGTENGEESLLSHNEKLDIFKTVSNVLKNKKLIIAGVDNPSISGTLKESEKYVEMGADLIRIRIPRRRETIDKYFDEVLKDIPKPVLIIHQMSPGGFASSMSTEGADPDQIGRFCDHDNVFGYIASHLVRFEMMTRKYVDQSKQFWIPNANLMPAMSLEGANGGCFMLGNIAPKICRNIIKLGLNGKFTEAKKLNDNLVDLDWNILSRGAAGIKYALDLLGFAGGEPRKPQKSLSEIDKKLIKDSLKSSGITEVE